jgi:Ca2+-dependent lipid-binding protein
VTYFLARFGFGWGWVFIVLAFCSSYYSQSMTKFRRHARDDIQRELVKVKLGSEHETTEWMNQFLQRFWLIYEPILSQTIVSSVDQILAMYTPGFLDSLKLTEFTLGTKAPRIDKVRTFPSTDDDIVMMDWAFSFTPHDTNDVPPGPRKKNANPKIVLSIRLGRGLATAALPVLVENIAFSGLMRIRLKLVSNFPHVQTVDMSFLEEPTIAYDLKPIGGDFGMDITNVCILISCAPGIPPDHLFTRSPDCPRSFVIPRIPF